MPIVQRSDREGGHWVDWPRSILMSPGQTCPLIFSWKETVYCRDPLLTSEVLSCSFLPVIRDFDSDKSLSRCLLQDLYFARKTEIVYRKDPFLQRPHWSYPPWLFNLEPQRIPLYLGGAHVAVRKFKTAKFNLHLSWNSLLKKLNIAKFRPVTGPICIRVGDNPLYQPRNPSVRRICLKASKVDE